VTLVDRSCGRYRGMGGELERMAHSKVGASEERPRMLVGDCLLE